VPIHYSINLLKKEVRKKNSKSKASNNKQISISKNKIKKIFGF
jgi:hypothetical protein